MLPRQVERDRRRRWRGAAACATALALPAAAYAQDRPARLVPESAVVSLDDYPAEAAAAGEGGSVRVQMLLPADGPPRCTATGPSALARRTCVIALHRWVYERAYVAGKRADATVRTVIAWPVPEGVEQRPAPAVTHVLEPPRLINGNELNQFVGYPDEARRAEEQGLVDFMVAVSADGRPTDCRVVASTASKRLDDRVRTVVCRRARFAPATVDGVPAPGVLLSTYRFYLEQLPDQIIR